MSLNVPNGAPRVLLVGYNGADNTGAEAKLLVALDEVRSVLGQGAHVVVPSLNEANLRRYLREGPNLSIKPVRPSLFFLDIRKLVSESDLVLLVEGSTYMDTWSSALLWYYLLATRYAHSMKKPCLAYSVDAGKASRFDSWLIKREASKTDLIISRTQEACDRLKRWGVEAPIEVTADNAFSFSPNQADKGLLRRVWPEASHVVGIAAEDIYKWPVGIRLWARRQYCYRWPYYYTHTEESLNKSERLAEGLASEADRIVETYDNDIALLAMEGLDTIFANRILSLMKHASRVRVFSSSDYNASQMTSVLRSLELLITSRYHAGVLSLPNQVPMTAIGHDLRIKDLFSDLDIPELFVDHEDPNRYSSLSRNVDALFEQKGEMRAKLRGGFEQYAERERRNPVLLRAFIESRRPGWLS